MNIGSILKACRERAGFNQEVMADLMNRDQGCISRIERNRKKPDIDTVLMWVEITESNDLFILYLFGREGMNILNSILQGSEQIPRREINVERSVS